MLAGIGSNLVGAVVVLAYLVPSRDRSLAPGSRQAEVYVLFGVYMLLVLPLANRVFVKINQPLYDAIRCGDPIVGQARRILFANPWRAALASLVGWAGAGLLFGAHDALRLGDSVAGGVWLGSTIMLGGLTTTALAYLFTEQAVRPAFALAFEDEPPGRSHGLDVWPRMMLSWFLGSMMPMLGIALAFWGRGAGDFNRLRNLVIGLVFAGMWAGGAITRRTARSVAVPLHSLRRAMADLQAGDLDARVTVDDASEIGLLQAGFNEMVSGLRERARLEDLFGRHVGVDVARYALEHGVELGGEIRDCSALFVDLVGSTALAATRPAAEVVEILNALFDAVVRVTGFESGWVNKFEGDAAMCVFGAPVDDIDHATHALRSARRLRVELSGLGARYGIDAGIGVASGAAVAGNVGAEDRYEYTVIGDPVNEAARLMETSKSTAARVLASGEAWARADDDERSRWRKCGTLELRGRSQPTDAYEPVPG